MGAEALRIALNAYKCAFLCGFAVISGGLKEMLLAGETNVLLLLLVCTLFPLLLL